MTYSPTVRRATRGVSEGAATIAAAKDQMPSAQRPTRVTHLESVVHHEDLRFEGRQGLAPAPCFGKGIGAADSVVHVSPDTATRRSVSTVDGGSSGGLCG